MRSLPIICFCILSLIYFSECLHSQDPVFYPKVYLHTDREVYFPGDSIWFKAYYLDGQSQQPVPGDFSLFVDFFNQGSQIIQNKVILLENGLSAGKIVIPDSILPGICLLRGFTDYQKNLGEDAFFYKTLEVKSVESSMYNTASQEMGLSPEIDVAFLPEGGFLLSGQRNAVGIKATNDKGLGVSVQGKVIDGQGNTVTEFHTVYKGMGAFQFKPLKGENYQVSIIGYPDFEYTFDDILDDGIKIEYLSESEDNLQFKITTNSQTLHGKSFHFAILHRGVVLFQQRFVQQGEYFPITVQKSALSAGINRFVLLDGMPVPMDVMMSIPMPDIDLIEVLKPYEAGIFGSRAGNGVISVFTKRGGDSGETDYEMEGTIARKIAGYSTFKEFYSPRYTSDNIDSERPDHRITLYWNPAVITEQGKASVSFFTSDDLTTYVIFVEGITSEGKICLGATEFKVNLDH